MYAEPSVVSVVSPKVICESNASDDGENSSHSEDSTAGGLVRSRRVFRVLGSALVLTGGVTGAVVALTVTKHKPENSTLTVSPTEAHMDFPTWNPTDAVTLPRQNYLLDLLETSIDPSDFFDYRNTLLENPLTPQAQALQWMSEDDKYTSHPQKFDDEELLQRYAVMVVYFSTSGPDWLVDSYSSVCSWNIGVDDHYHGILCRDATNFEAVTHVYLSGWGLSGTIPWEISLLKSLNTLTLGQNALSGSLPTQLFLLEDLHYLFLPSNALTGTLPAEMPESLEYLLLNNNSLTGTLHSEWADATPDMICLILESNAFEGSIPTEWGILQKLQVLTLGDNELTGTLPSELGQMTGITFLSLGQNEFTGSIPSELGNLSNLEVLLFYEDYQLSGTVPTELGNLSHLYAFSILETALTGSLENILCTAERLSVDDVSLEFTADCLGENAEVECSCCSYCCSPEGDCESMET